MNRKSALPYFPFGVQYYRAPSPHPEDWENDLGRIASLGFTHVKFWIQWRWNHPAEDRFYFDDIDRLMDLAEKNRLGVMLNTVFDVAPAWIYTQFSDASMITLGGRPVGPQTQPHRQIGGLGYCLSHPGIGEHFFRFLREAVRRYTHHPALSVWNVGSEPELTSSMAEWRLWADDAGKMDDMLCYCDHCRDRFRKWLENKYGDIGRLNAAWNRNYAGFEDAELPRTRNTFNDMVDWRMFFVHVLGENVRRRFEVAEEEDQKRHPLMCHHVFIQGFPVTSTANDPWNVGRFGDLHGITQMDEPMMIDVVRSCAGGKPVISAEMLMLPGYTLDYPAPINGNDVKRFVFSGLAGNLKGFLFWQYRPEILGREAPAWGLTRLDGSATPWLESFASVGKALAKQAGFLLESSPPDAEIALLYHPENQIFAWAATGKEKNATDSILGIHKALYENNFRIDVVHPADVARHALKRYKVLFIPFPYWLGEAVCSAIEYWIREGGVLISESHFSAWNVERGHHEKTVPGYGFDRIFQARQERVVPVGKDCYAEIRPVAEMPFLAEGDVIRGALAKEILVPDGAEVLARFDTGEAAATLAAYGKGKAVLIGSFIGLPVQRNGMKSNAGFIAGLVEMTASIRRPHVAGGRIRVDFLTGKNDRIMVIARNLDLEPADASVSLPVVKTSVLRELFSNENATLKQTPDGSAFTVHLDPKETRVYMD
ncbi:beta-galactosidase [bacterium]|nr:beta-galactosidase [bacterium]